MSAEAEGEHHHDHRHGDGGHSHGLVHTSIKRSHEGVRAVLLALLVLGLAAVAQAGVFVASSSVALLADLIHNIGDAATAVPLGIAFLLRSEHAERWAGLAVVAAIFLSACVAGYEAVDRLIDPRDVQALGGADRCVPPLPGEHARASPSLFPTSSRPARPPSSFAP